MKEVNKTAFALNSLPEYERQLLCSLAFFLGRDISAQAVACLSMYLRQSEPRILGQLNYYAHKATRKTGQPYTAYDLLDLIVEAPETAAEILQLTVVHSPGQRDVFEPGNESES